MKSRDQETFSPTSCFHTNDGKAKTYDRNKMSCTVLQIYQCKNYNQNWKPTVDEQPKRKFFALIKIDILWGSPSHATVVFMGVLKIINISLKRGKYKIDIKRVNHINYNQLFQSWDLKSEKVVFVFILKLRLLNSFIKWYEDRFLPQLVLHDGSLKFSLPLVLYLW